MKDQPRIVVLCPYSPWPIDSGAKAEMWKHLDILRGLGRVTLASAEGKPVGGGWTEQARAHVRGLGMDLVLREESCRMGPRQVWGMAYAALAKSTGQERAFGHANPYHRYAFPEKWWGRVSSGANLAVIFYSYGAHLKSPGRKACVLLDLWSDVMRGGTRAETRDLATCDWVCVISKSEEKTLRQRGLRHLFWSPPAVAEWPAGDNGCIGLVGSENRFNREGLAWLASGTPPDAPRVRIYGRLANFAHAAWADKIGPYVDAKAPYRDCGVLLFTAAHGSGVQIKTIEALSAGRAIVARPESVRGLPEGEPGWILVRSPGEMWHAASQLQKDAALRQATQLRARQYYQRHLSAPQILHDLTGEYRRLLA